MSEGLEWRSGPKPAAGSAFKPPSAARGGNGRGRPRGSVRGGAPSSSSTHSTATTFPSAALPPKPPSPLPPRPRTNSSNTAAKSIPTSTNKAHSQPRRMPSLSHLDIPRAAKASADSSLTPGGRPKMPPRSASHTPLKSPKPPPTSFTEASVPAVKLETVDPTTPTRPKAPRRRSHNRTRSSSKASQLSAKASISSLRSESPSGLLSASSAIKDAPPHLALRSAPPETTSFDLKNDIDSLVERVRANAIRDGPSSIGDGHIDWAGLEDDSSLPDLDDWIKPPVKQEGDKPKQIERCEEDKTQLSPVVEVTSPPLSTAMATTNPVEASAGPIGKVSAGKTSIADVSKWNLSEPDTQEVTAEMGSKPAPVLNRTKSRGRHGRKKSGQVDPLPAKSSGFTTPV